MYQRQMTDVVDRGGARKLSNEDLKDWRGPMFYNSHLAVNNPWAQYTPLRIVFNSSQVCNGEMSRLLHEQFGTCFTALERRESRASRRHQEDVQLGSFKAFKTALP